MPDYNFIKFQRNVDGRLLLSALEDTAKKLKWVYRQVPPTLENVRTAGAELSKRFLGGSVYCTVELGRSYPTIAVTSTLSMGNYDRFTEALKGALREEMLLRL